MRSGAGLAVVGVMLVACSTPADFARPEAPAASVDPLSPRVTTVEEQTSPPTPATSADAAPRSAGVESAAAPGARSAAAESPAAPGTLTASPLHVMRTTARAVRLRIRVDNRSAKSERLRLRGVTALSSPGGPSAVRSIQLLSVLPGEAYPTSPVGSTHAAVWFEVPNGEARIVEIETSHRPRFTPPDGVHRYRVRLDRDGQEPLSVETESFDATRDAFPR